MTPATAPDRPPRAEAPAPGLSGLLSHPAVPWALAVAFLLVNAALLRNPARINDEGLYTYINAEFAWHVPAAVFFYQKMKPIVTLLYLLPTRLGLDFFMLVHVAVAALAIPLASATARALGIARPNVAAFAMACAPVFFAGASAGVSNTDGSVFMLLALWLYAKGRPSAGLVLGTLPWVRHELGLFCLFLVALMVIRREWRAIACTAAFPLLYGIAGAIYHHDLLWMPHYPPSTWLPPDGLAFSTLMPITHEQAELSNVVPTVFDVSTAYLFVFSVRWKRLGALERMLFLFVTIWLVASVVMPRLQIGNFAFASRYVMATLPAAALLLARVIDQWLAGERPGAVPWIGLALCVFCCVFSIRDRFFGLQAGELLVLSGVVLGLASGGLSGWATGVLAVLLFVTPFCGFPDKIYTPESMHDLDLFRGWVVSHRSEIHGPIYTNEMLLAPYLARAGVTGLDIRYVLGVDQLGDVAMMTDPNNGQRAEIMRAGHEVKLAGAEGLPADELTPENAAADSLFVLRRKERRIVLALPPTVWARHFVPVAIDGYRILRFSRTVTGTDATY